MRNEDCAGDYGQDEEMPQLRSGYYSRGCEDEDGFVDAFGDIPIPVLFHRDCGSLGRVFAALPMAQVLGWLPTHQSAFDALLPRLRGSYSRDKFPLSPYPRSIVEALLKHGVNEANLLEQRWAAAKGPLPNLPDAETLCHDGMWAAFDALQDLSSAAVSDGDFDTYEVLLEAVERDLNAILSRAWDCLYGWDDTFGV